MVLRDLLYLAGTAEAAGVGQLPFQFSHVLHFASSRDAHTPYPYSRTARLINVWDEPGVDISLSFPEAIQFICDAEATTDARILVHCKQGISRSVASVAAYLMQERRMTLLESFELMAENRPQICPNPSFALQLEHFEKKIFGQNTLTMEEMKVRGWVPRAWDGEAMKFRN